MEEKRLHTLADSYLRHASGLTESELREMPLNMKLARLPLNLLLAVFAQEEFRFDELAPEIVVAIVARLPNSDLAHFCAVNRYLHGLCADIAFINEVLRQRHGKRFHRRQYEQRLPPDTFPRPMLRLRVFELTQIVYTPPPGPEQESGALFELHSAVPSIRSRFTFQCSALNRNPEARSQWNIRATLEDELGWPVLKGVLNQEMSNDADNLWFVPFDQYTPLVEVAAAEADVQVNRATMERLLYRFMDNGYTKLRRATVFHRRDREGETYYEGEFSL
jgi:hypothetical protein